MRCIYERVGFRRLDDGGKMKDEMVTEVENEKLIEAVKRKSPTEE